MTPPPNDQDSATLDPMKTTQRETRAAGPDKFQTIRELLIGDEFQGLDERFGSLEQTLEERHAKLRNEFLSEFKTLQSQGKAEVKELGDMVVEMVGQLQREDTSHTETIETIETRLTALEERLDGMGESISQQVRSYHEEFSGKLGELSRNVKVHQEQAARQSISRTELAKVLSGLAASLLPQESEAQASTPPESEVEHEESPFHPG